MHSPSEEHQLVVCPCKGCSSSHDDIRAYISTHVYEFYKNKNDVVAGVNQVMVMVSTLATKYMHVHTLYSLLPLRVSLGSGVGRSIRNTTLSSSVLPRMN